MKAAAWAQQRSLVGGRPARPRPPAPKPRAAPPGGSRSACVNSSQQLPRPAPDAHRITRRAVIGGLAALVAPLPAARAAVREKAGGVQQQEEVPVVPEAQGTGEEDGDASPGFSAVDGVALAAAVAAGGVAVQSKQEADRLGLAASDELKAAAAESAAAIAAREADAAALAGRLAEVESAVAEDGALKDRLGLVTQELHRAEAELEIAKADSEAAMAKLAGERMNSDVVEKARAAAVADAIGMMSKLRDLEFLAKDEEERRGAAEAQLAEARAEAEQARATLATAEAELAEARSAPPAADPAAVEALEALAEELQGKCDLLERARAAAVKDAMKAMGTVRDLEFEVADERDAREELTAEVKALEESLHEAQQMAPPPGETVRLQESLADARTRLQRAQQRGSQLEKEVLSLRRELARRDAREARAGGAGVMEGDGVVMVAEEAGGKKKQRGGAAGAAADAEVMLERVRQQVREETRREVEEAVAATLETERRLAAEGAARRAAEAAAVRIREARSEVEHLQDENTRLLSQLEAEREKVIAMVGGQGLRGVAGGVGAGGGLLGVAGDGESDGVARDVRLSSKPTLDEIDAMIGRQLDECIREWGVAGSRSSMRVGQKKEILKQFFYPGSSSRF